MVPDIPYVLFLSRINWKKGLDRLVKAWRLVPDMNLIIAGNDEENYRVEIERLAQSEGVADRIRFIGPAHGHDKWLLYKNAQLFVLPSYSENFGIVVAEALGCGKPVLISNQVNIWREIEASGAGFVEDDTLEGCKRLLLSWSELANPDRTKMQDQAKLCFENNFRVESSVATILEILRNIKHAQ